MKTPRFAEAFLVARIDILAALTYGPASAKRLPTEVQMGHLPIVLGSSSKWRAAVLREAGVPFTVRSPDIDEKAIRNDNPYMLTLAIAQAKARAILPTIEGTSDGPLVVTADQVAVFRGEIREKPRSRTQARRWLEQYREDGVHVVSTVVVSHAGSGDSRNGHDTVAVEFGPFPDEVIDALLGKGDVLYSCGGFVYEDPAIAPFTRSHRSEKVIGFAKLRDQATDPDVMSSISGLPLKLTLQLLRQLGWERRGNPTP